MTVSIIIPVYEVSDYIERCLKSVMNQTYKDIECILVDDASPDDSIAKCEQMMAAYQGPARFSIVHHQQNRGLSAARNTGTDAATGDYVYYLDSDDELTNDCIEKLIRPVTKDATVEMVMGNYMRVAEGCQIGASERLTLTLEEEDINSREAIRGRYFEKGVWQSAWNKLIKRTFLQQHQVRFKEGIFWEDTLWFFFVVKYLSHLYIIPDVTYHYVKRPQGITTGSVKGQELVNSWCIVYDEIASYFTKGDRRREVKYHWKGFCVRCIGNPDNQEYRRIAKKYKKVLREEHCLYDLILLNEIVFLSKYRWGKTAFNRAAKQIRLSKKHEYSHF